MHSLATSPQPLVKRVSRVVIVLAALLAGLAMLAPQAEAAKKKRVVAISPFAAATMVKLGVKPIAVGETIGGDRRKPRALRRVRVLKLSHPNGPNLEQLARLRPDVVFTSNRWRKGTAGMERLGIKVVNADPLKVNQVYRNVKKIGRHVGRARKARRLNKSIRKRLRRSTRRIRERPRVMVVLGIGNTAMAFLKNSWGGQLVRRAGGNLITHGYTNGGGFARISDEIVMAENPEVIIVVPHGNTDDLSRISDYIKNNQFWRETDAVKNDRIKVSTQNELLQAGTDVGRIIRKIRRQWLKNW